MPRIKGQDRRQRGGPLELVPRLDWLRQALADFEATYHAAMDAESWGAAVQAKTKAVQVRGEIDEIEQVQAARDHVIRQIDPETYYEELIGTVRALRVGAMASGSHVAAVSALKLEGELVSAKAAASERAAAAAREAMSDQDLEAEILRLQGLRGYADVAGDTH